MPSKFFNVNNRQQIVTIVEDKGKFYELSDGNMIKKDTFMQKYQPVLDDVNESVQTPTFQEGNNTGTLNPDNFFNVKSVSDEVINRVQKTDPSKGVGDDNVNRTEVTHKGTGQESRKSPSMNESLVRQVDENEQVIPNNTNTDVSQYKVYDNEDDSYADFENKNKSVQPQKPQMPNIEEKKMEIELLFDDEKLALGEEEAILRRSKRLLKLPTTKQETEVTVPNTESEPGQVQPQTQPQLSPIEMMFSTFKRKHLITINVSFDDMIGEPDFVKLMVENMDGDIVGYYKNLIMKNIMKNLSKIEEAVEREIQLEIFGEIIEKPKSDKSTLIEGGKTKTGKQKYKYVDDEGNVKELLPGTAKTKGYEPYQEK